MAQMVFKRYEKKYLIDIENYNKILEEISDYTVPDKYGESDVCNIYFDTPDFRIIRASIQKPVYKEKLRLRSYGTPDDYSPCFLELKKKYKGIVYKRRISEEYLKGYNYLLTIEDTLPCSQIKNEIAYFKEIYGNPQPAMNIFYKRRAFYLKNDKNVRFTFDWDVRYKNYELDLKNGIYGEKLLPDNKIIMEIKTAGAVPLWTAEMLNRMCIYPSGFSKYGNAYLKMLSSDTEINKYFFIGENTNV